GLGAEPEGYGNALTVQMANYRQKLSAGADGGEALELGCDRGSSEPFLAGRIHTGGVVCTQLLLARVRVGRSMSSGLENLMNGFGDPVLHVAPDSDRVERSRERGGVQPGAVSVAIEVATGRTGGIHEGRVEAAG